MNGLFRLAIQATLLALVATAVPAQADLMWGVNGHPLSAYPGVTTPRQLDYIRDLGLKSYRVNISRTTELPGLTYLVREGKARGIDILPVITPANVDLDRDTPKEIYTKTFNLAVALIKPLKNDVRVWELGNELENYAIIKACEMRDDGTQYNCAWGPAGGVSPLDYYGPRWAKVSAVLKGLSDGAVSVDPTIRKAMGTAGWGHTGAFARMQQDNIGWDISAWHLYGQDPEWAFKILAGFKRPIWVTELNNSEGSQAGEAQQATGLTQMAMRLRQLQPIYGVEAAHVYELMDEPYWAPSFEASMGLVRLDKTGAGGWTPGDPKPAYHAIKQLVRGNKTVPMVKRDCDLKADDKTASVARQQVSYAYCLILGRAADGGGLDDWSNLLDHGGSMAELLVDLLGGDEFGEKYATFGLSNSDYVKLLYRLLVDRDPDGKGQADYAARLDARSLSRSELAKAIIGSSEFQAKQPLLFASRQAKSANGSDVAEAKATAAAKPVRRDCDLKSFPSNSAHSNQVAYAFCLVVGRQPDGYGLQDWTILLDKGSTTRHMLIAMLGSEEFHANYATASLGNHDYVTLLYRLLLDREPDGGGLASYVAELDGGLSRTDLQKAVIGTGEFTARHPILFPVAKPSQAD